MHTQATESQLTLSNKRQREYTKRKQKMHHGTQQLQTPMILRNPFTCRNCRFYFQVDGQYNIILQSQKKQELSNDHDHDLYSFYIRPSDYVERHAAVNN